MLVDAIVLTGGRSSRLDSVPKSELVFEQQTLLHRTLAAVRDARTVVVVGPDAARPLPVGIISARENPVFGGPAAGIAAGMAALKRSSTTISDATLVLACDMPHIDRAIPLLLRGLADNPKSDGVIAVDDDERLQPLAAGYRTHQLAKVIAACESAAPLDSLSVFSLISGLNLIPLDMPSEATADVDTWEDAHRLGVFTNPPPSLLNKGDPVNDEERSTIEEWAAKLSAALGLTGLELDIDGVLDLAGSAARSVVRPAAPLTTFIVGYAAGRAATEGAVPEQAIREATATAVALCEAG